MKKIAIRFIIWFCIIDLILMALVYRMEHPRKKC